MHASIFSSVSLQQAGCDRQERTALLLLSLPLVYWFSLAAARNVKSGVSPLVQYMGSRRLLIRPCTGGFCRPMKLNVETFEVTRHKRSSRPPAQEIECW